jgi:hypothetical protein
VKFGATAQKSSSYSKEEATKGLHLPEVR